MIEKLKLKRAEIIDVDYGKIRSRTIRRICRRTKPDERPKTLDEEIEKCFTLLIRSSCIASNNPEEFFEHAEFASDATFSNITIHRCLAVQNSFFYLLGQRLTKYGFDRFRQQFRIVFVDVR